jgi:hypothetical protein
LRTRIAGFYHLIIPGPTGRCRLRGASDTEAETSPALPSADMSAATRQLGPATDEQSRRAVIATRILVAAFLVTVLLGLVDAGRRIGELDRRGDEARRSRSDPADAAGGAAEAFRRARSHLHPGDRYTLVLPKLTRDLAGHYRLVALSYLYPAIAVPNAGQADVVMVFGDPSAPILTAFEEIEVVSGVWLGRRRA